MSTSTLSRCKQTSKAVFAFTETYKSDIELQLWHLHVKIDPNKNNSPHYTLSPLSPDNPNEVLDVDIPNAQSQSGAFEKPPLCRIYLIHLDMGDYSETNSKTWINHLQRAINDTKIVCDKLIVDKFSWLDLHNLKGFIQFSEIELIGNTSPTQLQKVNDSQVVETDLEIGKWIKYASKVAVYDNFQLWEVGQMKDFFSAIIINRQVRGNLLHLSWVSLNPRYQTIPLNYLSGLTLMYRGVQCNPQRKSETQRILILGLKIDGGVAYFFNYGGTCDVKFVDYGILLKLSTFFPHGMLKPKWWKELVDISRSVEDVCKNLTRHDVI